MGEPNQWERKTLFKLNVIHLQGLTYAGSGDLKPGIVPGVAVEAGNGMSGTTLAEW